MPASKLTMFFVLLLLATVTGKKPPPDDSIEDHHNNRDDDDNPFHYTGPVPTDKPKTPVNVGLIVALAVGLPVGFVALFLAGFFVYLYRKRRRRAPVTDIHPAFGHVNKYLTHLPESVPPACAAYDDPWALPSSRIVVDHDAKLGSGAFCNVYKAQLAGPAPLRSIYPGVISLQRFEDCVVAAKCLPSFADDIAKSDFQQEINFMKTLGCHEYIVAMLGWVPDPRSPMLLVEYCARGDLLHLVRSRREQLEAGVDEYGLKVKNLVVFAWQVSNGLEHLNSLGCIHRDVAARNVLVDEDFTCKIGDFGLCRLTDNLLYTARGGRLPLRWLSLESLRSFEYSFQSDVWSFGVLLYELMSIGEVPYGAVDNDRLLEFLEEGNRLERPRLCTEEVYAVMRSCWAEDPAERPSFTELCKRLRGFIEDASDDYGYLENVVLSD